jgi:hypothetical protein
MSDYFVCTSLPDGYFLDVSLSGFSSDSKLFFFQYGYSTKTN